MVKKSIATVSISGNLTEKLKAISEAGFEGIEIFEQDFIADLSSPRDIGKMIRDHGLEITLFQPFRDFEGLPNPYRKKAFDRAERKFDIMQELGTDLILICSSVHPQSMGGIDRAADDFNELGDRAAKRDLKVGYEALCWGRHINDHRDAWEVVRRANHSNVGLILDSFHTIGKGISSNNIRSIPANKIFFVQLADAPQIEMDLLYWSRHFRNMPGEGDLNVTQFMRDVMATGYRGPISLEIFNDQFRGGDARIIAKDGYRSLTSLMDDVKKQEPEIPINVIDLPKRGTIDSVSFIEFISRNEEARSIEKQLVSLGFKKTAVHSEKLMTCWEQEQIRIILNEEKTQRSNRLWDAIGSSVRDIGFIIPDTKKAFKRAKELGAKSLQEDLLHQNNNTSTIKGLAESAIYLLDTPLNLDKGWKKEIMPQEKTDNINLISIDHMAQTMSYESMLSWTLFYTTLFDMKKSDIRDVIDPDGLVRSQVLETETKSIRLTLNGVDTYRTFAGSFLEKSFEGSVQHIAFATKDIFKTVDLMRSNSFPPLKISPNYYDDLIARFDISTTLLGDLKTRNILYDEDEGGSFLHCYTPSMPNGFFFEIIQREGKYEGFGGPNAPYRIAAQKRADIFVNKI